MNYKKIGAIALSTGLMAVAVIAHADYSTSTFTLASAQADVNQLFVDMGVMVGLTIGAVLTMIVGLLGLGFAYRKIKGKVTGKKF